MSGWSRSFLPSIVRNSPLFYTGFLLLSDLLSVLSSKGKGGEEGGGRDGRWLRRRRAGGGSRTSSTTR